MKQSDIFVLDKCEITVDKKNNTLNMKWIYTIWESQKVLLCAPLSPISSFRRKNKRKKLLRARPHVIQ